MAPIPVEALIKAGSFDRLGGNRAQMMAGLERAMQTGAGMQADLASGQMNFFEEMTQNEGYAEDKNHLPDVPPWPEQQMLTFEKQVLGFYVTSNPLSQHAEDINIFSTCNTGRLGQVKAEKEVVVGGMIARIRYNIIKNGRNAGAKMAVIMLEDLQGQVEVVVFPKVYVKTHVLLEEEQIVILEAEVQKTENTVKLIGEKIVPIEQAENEWTSGIVIHVDGARHGTEIFDRIKPVIEGYPGDCVSLFKIKIDGDHPHVMVKLSDEYRTDADPGFFTAVEGILGEGTIETRCAPVKDKVKKKKRWQKKSA